MLKYLIHFFSKTKVLDKTNLVEKLIKDIYDGDYSRLGSRGKRVKIAIENRVIEIDNVRIIPNSLLGEIYYDIDILISSDMCILIQDEYLRKQKIFDKTKIPEFTNVRYPIFTNESCEQYEVALNCLKRFVNRTNRYKWFESDCCELSFTYHP